MTPSNSCWQGLLLFLIVVITHLVHAKGDFSGNYAVSFIQQEIRLARGAVKPWPYEQPVFMTPHGESPKPHEEPISLTPDPPEEPQPLRPHSDLELDGGGEPFRIFPGIAPKEKNWDRRKETFVPADPDDPVGKRCCPGDVKGYWYYNVSTPVMVPFILAADDPKRTDAAVLVIPGGGWRFLAWHKEGTHVAKWLNSIGINAFVVKYRVPDPDMAQGKGQIDVQRALSLVRYRASEFGLNSSRIGVIGFSAGGILSADVSTIKDRKYAAKDAADKMSHIPNFVIMIYAFGNPLSPGAKSAPPTFIALANDDQCVPPKLAEAYYRALVTKGGGNGHELHVFAEGRHGYGDCSMYVQDMQWKDVCEWTDLVKNYLQSQVFGNHDEITFEP